MRPPLRPRRPLPIWLLVVVVVALLAPAGAEAGRRRTRPSVIESGGSYSAAELGRVPPGVPREVELLLPTGVSWPDPLVRAYAERVRRDWPLARSYGVLSAAVPTWFDAPAVTQRRGDRVVVPVWLGAELPLAGRVGLPEAAAGRRRVIVLIDASQSANARLRVEGPDGQPERVTVLEAERRALRRLLETATRPDLELGVIAFGEGTWPVAEPEVDRAAALRALARFERDHPEGAGRTDTVCALHSAVRWLEDSPAGASREIVLLTDGDLPYSGRFTRCVGTRREARDACLARVNRSPCPAADALRTGSDAVQLAHFSRRTRRRVRVTPVVFEADRAAFAYRQLAEKSGGRLVRVAGAGSLDDLLPALLATRIEAVVAENRTTGERTDDLRDPTGSGFAGRIGLASGANDIELRVETDLGTATRLRLRVHAAAQELERWLARLREHNRALEDRDQELLAEARRAPPPAKAAEPAAGRRTLGIEVEPGR